MIEAFGPEFLVAVEPVIGLFHRFGAQPAGDRPPALGSSDQAGIRQHVEVLHHRRQRHRKRPGEFADRQVFLFAQAGEQSAARGVGQRADRKAVGLAQPCQQGPPRRVGERGEGAVECRLLILNHQVKY